MFHWQWFILIITISFVVSNGGTRTKTRRSINIDPSFKEKRETREEEKLSTNVAFPLWVTIRNLDSLGAKTEYTKIDENLYEFTLPFLVLVKESDVDANRSAIQDPNLAYPFWVRVSDADGQYANETVEGKVRFSFPFDLEVADMSLIVGEEEGIKSESRIVLIGVTVVGTISLSGIVAFGSAVVSTLVGGFVLTSVVRLSIKALVNVSVGLFRPISHNIVFNLINNSKKIFGAIVAGVTGAIVSFVPELGNALKKGITQMFQIGGCPVVTFLNEVLSLHAIGDVAKGINVALQIFFSLPFKPWRLIRRPHRPGKGRYQPPPIIIVPVLPKPPPSELETILVINIYYGQTTIPGFPGYIIVWPGKQEPPTTDSVIIRPVIPTLPYRPNIRLVWPVQATNNVRPNVILIRPGQRLIPGYVSIVIVWPGEPAPNDKDLIVIRPNDREIPNIVGVVLMWPRQPSAVGTFYINLLPWQRQDPQFPTIIFLYRGDPSPPHVPGLTIVSPPDSNIPDYPGIVIIWPREVAPTKVVKPPPPQPIVCGTNDRQVPGHPDIVIVLPGIPQPRPCPGITYVVQGQTSVPGHPEITLTWPPQPGGTVAYTTITIYIAPGMTTLPGYPEFTVNPGASPWSGGRSVRPGDKTLPNNPNVFLVWLDRPTDLVIEASPDIANCKCTYEPSIDRAYKRKRNAKRSIASLNAVNDQQTLQREFLQILDTDVIETEFGRRNTTFIENYSEITMDQYGKTKFAHEKETEQTHWNFSIKKSQLKQWFKQLFGLS